MLLGYRGAMRRRTSKAIKLPCLPLNCQRLVLIGVFSLGIFLSCWLLINTLTLRLATSGSVDAFFVLGGSIRREVYIGQVAKQYPQTRILISQGSPDPCIWRIFQQEHAPMQQVFLEKCAHSTFDNFYYGLPILRHWKVHKVQLITSPSHLPRAMWLAQIILGSHGIWVEPKIVQEQGIPGNRESFFKTGLDLTRSLVWAILSHIIQPKCSTVVRLADIDMQSWQRQGFSCEHQGHL